MSDSASALSQQLLIALPSLSDPNFSRTVTLICQHDDNGAMGIVINRASEYSIGQLLSQLEIDITNSATELLERPVLAGGPVHAERGFVLHDGDKAWDSSIRLPNGFALTTSRDVLEALAAGQGPERALVALGCAGWGAGQLEQEIAENSWMTAPADGELLFNLPLEQRWMAAAGKIGVNLMQMTHYSGRA
ncbi:YqgE/AlgH family protein [Luteimonas sp. e5]